MNLFKFKLPSRDNREYRHSLLFYPIITKEKYIKDDDYYILYNTEKIIRVVVFFVLFISVFFALWSDEDKLSLWFYDFLNRAGGFLILPLPLYLIFYLKNVDLNKYNIFRAQGYSSISDFDLKMKRSVFLSFPLSLFASCNVGNGLRGIFSFGSMNELFENHLWFSSLFLLSVLCLSLCLYATYFTSILLIAYVYERFKK